VREGAIKPWRIGGKNLIIKHNALLRQLVEQLPFNADIPWRDLPEATRQILLYGAGERMFAFKLRRMREPRALPFAGVIADLEKSYRDTESDGFRARLSTYMVSGPCPECHGARLSARSSAVTVRATRSETPNSRLQIPNEIPNAKVQTPNNLTAGETPNAKSQLQTIWRRLKFQTPNAKFQIARRSPKSKIKNQKSKMT